MYRFNSTQLKTLISFGFDLVKLNSFVYWFFN